MEDLQELLKLIDKAENEVVSGGLDTLPNNIRNFISSYNIEVGRTKYPANIIFYLYRQVWDGITLRNKNGKVSFFIYFSRVFRSKRTKKQRYYELNNFIEITEELKEAAERYDKIYEQKSKKKKN